MAQVYANGLVTIVRIPDVEVEQDRELMRSRQNLLQQQTRLRKHLQALPRRKDELQDPDLNKTHWTKHHYC